MAFRITLYLVTLLFSLGINLFNEDVRTVYNVGSIESAIKGIEGDFAIGTSSDFQFNPFQRCSSSPNNLRLPVKRDSNGFQIALRYRDNSLFNTIFNLFCFTQSHRLVGDKEPYRHFIMLRKFII